MFANSNFFQRQQMTKKFMKLPQCRELNRIRSRSLWPTHMSLCVFCQHLKQGQYIFIRLAIMSLWQNIPFFNVVSLVEPCSSSRYTGCAIKNGTHSFNHTCSHDRNPSNFKTTFICFYIELSFEVYNSFLGQLA